MEKEQDIIKEENNIEETEYRAEEKIEFHESDSHSRRSSDLYYRSGPHHSSHHGSTSHHRSGSHHHHSNAGSRPGKKNKSKKIGLFKKIQAKFDKKFGKNSALVQLLILLFVIAIIIVGVFFAEKHLINNQVPSEVNTPGDKIISNVVDSDGAQSTSIPSYWKNELLEKANLVKSLQTAGGKDSVSFVWASDTHIPDNSDGRTDYLGALMTYMLDNCDIPFAVISGDVSTRASYATEAELINSQKKLSKHLAPLWGTDRLLVALGNHEGCWGDASGYYRKQMPPEKLWQIFFRNQALDFRRVFSDDGTYYYIDNVAQKVRFIILNSQFGGEYSTDGNGWAINNRFATSCYGQQQLDWLADTLLNMPVGFGAIIVTHVPPDGANGANGEPYTVDYAQICGIIDAYNNKTSFSGSYMDGVDGWSNSVVDVNFTHAEAEVIAAFAGHIHTDTLDTTTLTCPIITIYAAGAAPDTDMNKMERVLGTDTETSFDVVTINRKTRTIYCTRVGAGFDREIRY